MSRRRAAELELAQHINSMALPAAMDLLDTYMTFGDISEDDDAEEKFRVIIEALKGCAAHLTLRHTEPAE